MVIALKSPDQVIAISNPKFLVICDDQHNRNSPDTHMQWYNIPNYVR